MKLILKTLPGSTELSGKTFSIPLPNRFNTDYATDFILELLATDFSGETIKETRLMGDHYITNEERKQLDIHGEVISAPIVMDCSSHISPEWLR